MLTQQLRRSGVDLSEAGAQMLHQQRVLVALGQGNLVHEPSGFGSLSWPGGNAALAALPGNSL